jgi:thiamine-monophosphate kinase
MAKLAEFREKDFIRSILARYASTAQSEQFEDCVVIDPLSAGLGFSDALFVYSIDHPSKIKRPLPPELEWRFYGRWIAACTAGDVLAMGAKPTGFALDLAVPLSCEVAHIEQIYAGLLDVLQEYGATLEGGNLDVNEKLETVGMCWGVVERSRIIRRSGARPGDIVAVTTELGLGWASYLLLKAGLFEELSQASREFLLTYNLMPIAPHRAMLAAAAIPGAITSGMDLTDGVAEFLHTIAERNDVGVRLKEEQIPGHHILSEAASLLEVSPLHLALDPGYDTPRVHGYTVQPSLWDDAATAFARNGATLFPIGEVTRDAKVLIEGRGGFQEVPKFVDDQFEKGSVTERWRERVCCLPIKA